MKFRFSMKTTKFDPMFHLDFSLFKFMWKIKSNFVDFLENLTFTKKIFFFCKRKYRFLRMLLQKLVHPIVGSCCCWLCSCLYSFFPKKIQRWAVHHLEIMEERLLELHLWLCNFNSTCNKSWHLSSAMCWDAFRHSWSKFRKGGEIKISIQSFYRKWIQALLNWRNRCFNVIIDFFITECFDIKQEN